MGRERDGTQNRKLIQITVFFRNRLQLVKDLICLVGNRFSRKVLGF
jgi:hypothetical protein